MDYVESLNFFGVEAKQIPCIKGNGVPTKATKGAVGCLYMDTVTGDMYKCTAVVGSVYTWKKVVEEDKVISQAESKFNNQYGNAIKRTVIGERYIYISNEDGYMELPPFEHDIIVKLRRKNLYNCEDECLENDCGVTLTHAGGKTILNGTVNGAGLYIPMVWFNCFDDWTEEYRPGDYTFSIQSLGGAIKSGELVFSVAVDGESASGRITTNLKIEGGDEHSFRTGRDYPDENCFVEFFADEGTVFDNFTFACQWEYRNNASAFTPYIDDLSDIVVHSVGIDGIVNTHAPDESGICVINSAELRDLYECALQTKSGVIMEVELHRDINTVIEELTNAIISMGGNV